MKEPSKFKRWFLGLFGGVPKSDYNFVVEQRDNFVGDLKINNSRIKELEQENELLKKQVAHDPMTPVRIIKQNVKIKEIRRVASVGALPLEQIDLCLRDAVLEEAASFIKIEHKLRDLTATATLLLAEIEDD